jgi:hypothetical protein
MLGVRKEGKEEREATIQKNRLNVALVPKNAVQLKQA